VIPRTHYITDRLAYLGTREHPFLPHKRKNECRRPLELPTDPTLEQSGLAAPSLRSIAPSTSASMSDRNISLSLLSTLTGT